MRLRALLVLGALLGSGICGWAEDFDGSLPHPPIPLLDPTASGKLSTAGTPIAALVNLYEEDPFDPYGKRSAGSVTWRTETVSGEPGKPPELAVRADIEVPGREMSVTLWLRRDPKSTGLTSHTIEIMFKLPPDFSGGRINNVPGVWLKEGEAKKGVALAGLSVRVAAEYFLFGLSNAPADRARNIRILKDRTWFDIPIVYTNNNRRAILVVEKGVSGERAFADAFAAWEVALSEDPPSPSPPPAPSSQTDSPTSEDP